MAWNVRTSSQVSASLEIFKFPPNEQGFASIVLDASAVVPDSDGLRKLVAGTLLSKNSNNQYERYTGAGAANEVTVVDLTGLSEGTFTLTIDVNGDEQTTAAIAFDAATAAVDAAIEALSNVVAVTTAQVTAPSAGVSGGKYTVTFTSPGNQDVTVTGVDTDSTGDVTISTTTEGDIAQAVKGVLAHDVLFVDGTAKSDQPAAMAFHGEVFLANRIVDFGSLGSAARTALPTCRFD